MATIISIVGATFVVISALMSLVLANVLDMQLNDRVDTLVQQSGPWIVGDISLGRTIADALVARPVPEGTVAILIRATGEVEGGVAASHGVQVLTDTQIRSADVHVLDGATPVSVALPGEGEFRVARVPTVSGGGTLLMGLSSDEVRTAVGSVVLTIALATVAGLLMLAAAVTLVVRSGLRPLVVTARTATRVAGQRLDHGDVTIVERVPPDLTDARTEIGQVGVALNTLLDHVEQSLTARQRNEELMRQFVADASHELRTPLASIRGYSELSLRDPDLGATTEQALTRIHAQSVRMTALVEDLLLLARLEDRTATPTGTADLTQIALEGVADQRAISPTHRWEIDVPETPVTVPGDRSQVTQVVVNLLANARMHTPDGTTIRLSLRTDPSADVVVLEVSDTGPGIDPAVRESLFSRFARGDTSRTRDTGGTGLGLSIVQAIVAAHGGRIAVESSGAGSTFTVMLPLARIENHDPGHEI